MKADKVLFWTSLFFSQIIGLFLTLLWSQIPLLTNLESAFRDKLLQTNANKVDVENLPIEIVDLNSLNLRDLDQSAKHSCELIRFLLLTAKAKVLVVNLPHSFVEKANKNSFCLLELIKTHAVEKIILVGYTKPLSEEKLPTISDYSYLNPFNFLSPEYQRSSKSSIGFFEYQPESLSSFHSLQSPARQVFLQGDFFNIVQHKKQNITNFGLLALGDSSPLVEKNVGQVGFQYFGKTNTFSSTSIKTICPQRDSCPANQNIINQFKNKIVIIGITDFEHPIESSLHMNSIWNQPMSNVEIQANIIASFLTNNIYKNVSNIILFLNTLLLVLVSVSTVYFYLTKQNKLFLFLFFFLISSYILLGIVLFYSGYFLTIVEPAIIYFTTGVFSLVYVKYQRKKQWIQYKLEELEKIKRIEENAALTTAKKLLSRVAIDIHDGALQELKLAMDDLELIQFEQDDRQIDQVLNRLESTAKQIRVELSNTSQLAQKMGISPQLKQGLSHGINLVIDELIATNKLSIKVINQVSNLEEPFFNSDWLAQREDIFRFFKEAMNNIIKHAQPPFGTADFVKINLSVQEQLLQLTIENNGDVSPSGQPTKDANTIHYGTKMMNTIASDLPQGKWHRDYLENGGVIVALKWNMNYFWQENQENND